MSAETLGFKAESNDMDQMGIATSNLAIIRVEGEKLKLACGSEEEAVPSPCVRRSRLLQDILVGSDLKGDALLPIGADAARAWMQHVNGTTTPVATKTCSCTAGVFHSSDASEVDGENEHLNDALKADSERVHMNDLLGLYMAADILIDDTTKAHAAAELGALLQSCAEEQSAAISICCNHNTDHRRASRAPRPCSHLSRAPPALSPPHAKHSVLFCGPRSSPFRRRQRRPLPRALPPAPRRHAARPRRCSHPHPPLQPLLCRPDSPVQPRHHHRGPLRPPGTHRPQRLQHTLVGGRCDRPCRHAAVPAPPGQPRPQQECYDHDTDTMRALAPAIAECLSLRRLNLLQTMPLTSDGYSTMHVLAQSATALAHITSLAVGSRGCRHYDGADYSSTPHDVLCSLACLPLLQTLDLDLSSWAAASDAAAISVALPELAQLESLGYTVFGLPDDETSQSGSEVDFGVAGNDADVCGSPWWDCGAALGKLTALRALELRFDGCWPQLKQEPWLLAIGSLVHLRRLHLDFTDGDVSDTDAATLPATLALLTNLTQLRVFRNIVVSISNDHDPDLAGVASVACALPKLQTLHIPVSTESTDAFRQTLLNATHLKSLTVCMCTGSLDGSGVDIIPWLPLVPAATSLCIDVYGHVGGDDHSEWMRELAAAIADSSSLTSLCFRWPCAWCMRHQPRAHEEILRAAAGLPGLRKLCTKFGECDTEGITVHSSDVHRMSGLTDLNVSGRTLIAERGANGVEAMTSLRSLSCIEVSVARAVCIQRCRSWRCIR
eukprot:jgi/Ulvmu1/2536/UM139_0004.1